MFVKSFHPVFFESSEKIKHKKFLTGGAKSGTIGSGGDAKIKNIIENPVEQRNSGKGNPNAISHFGIPLNNRQKKLLDILGSYDSRAKVSKKEVNMKDLSALTAATGDEFALFTKGRTRLIIRGNYESVNVNETIAQQLKEQGYKWSGHTHPGHTALCLWASNGDKLILKKFNQETSVIHNSKGQFLIFGREENDIDEY